MIVINSSKEASHLSQSKCRDEYLANTARFILSMMKQVTPEDSWQESHHGSFIVVEQHDHPIDDFQFIGRQGLLSDLFDDSEIGEDNFATPFEWAFHHPQFELYELYRQNNDETATVFIIPESYVEAHSDLRRLIEEYLAVRTEGTASTEREAGGEVNTEGTADGTVETANTKTIRREGQ